MRISSLLLLFETLVDLLRKHSRKEWCTFREYARLEMSSHSFAQGQVLLPPPLCGLAAAGLARFGGVDQEDQLPAPGHA